MDAAPTPAARWRDVDGILLLDKPEGITSNAALQRARRAFRARKAGHTGSLDPLASGLLPLCFGQATKASALLLDADKTYRVAIALGERTATADREGEVIERAAIPDSLTESSVREVAERFLGESEQVPPMYSALKHEGERLYRLARQGLEVERPPRRIVIRRLELLAAGDGRLEFEVDCSKGTYVRTLAEDIARACGTVGHVHALRRLRLGPFDAPRMQTLAAIEELTGQLEALDQLLLPCDAALPGLPAVWLGAAEQACVLHGQAVFTAGPAACQVRMYGPDGRFLGVGRMSGEGRQLAPERIMVDLSGQAPVMA